MDLQSDKFQDVIRKSIGLRNIWEQFYKECWIKGPIQKNFKKDVFVLFFNSIFILKYKNSDIKREFQYFNSLK